MAQSQAALFHGARLRRGDGVVTGIWGGVFRIAYSVFRVAFHTSHGLAFAKLVRMAAEALSRPRWNPEEHARWQRQVSGGKLSHGDAELATARADRAFTTKGK